MRGERKPNVKHYFVLPHLSIPLQICNGTDTNGIILTHMQHLMGAVFCVWCGICAKCYYRCFKGFNLNETCLRRFVKKDFGNICTRKIYPTNLDQGARQAWKHDQSTVNLQVISGKLSCQRNNKVQDEGEGSFLRKWLFHPYFMHFSN